MGTGDGDGGGGHRDRNTEGAPVGQELDRESAGRVREGNIGTGTPVGDGRGHRNIAVGVGGTEEQRVGAVGRPRRSTATARLGRDRRGQAL